MNSFQIGTKTFKLNKIDVFKQFHIARRIGPILVDILPALTSLKKISDKQNELSEEKKFEEITKLLTPLLNGFSKLSDEDFNKVLLGLLSSVDYQQPTLGNWARVATDSIILFQDLEMTELVQIASRAFMFNLQGFFHALPQK